MNAVIEANYSDFTLVKTRSTAQLILEIPIEQAEAAIQIFGIPQPGQEIRVAVARLNTNVAPQDGLASANATDAVQGAGIGGVTKSDRSRQAYADATEGDRAVTRAAMYCADPEFQAWCGVIGDVVATAASLRQALGIQSRREIATMPGLDAFRVLETQYLVFSGKMADPR